MESSRASDGSTWNFLERWRAWQLSKAGWRSYCGPVERCWFQEIVNGVTNSFTVRKHELSGWASLNRTSGASLVFEPTNQDCALRRGLPTKNFRVSIESLWLGGTRQSMRYLPWR